MKKILTKRLGIALGICAALLISCLCLALFPMHSLASKAEITFSRGRRTERYIYRWRKPAYPDGNDRIGWPIIYGGFAYTLLSERSNYRCKYGFTG